MMSPVEDDVVINPVQRMQRIFPDIGQLQGLQRELLDFSQELRLDDLATEKMVWVSKDGDVGVKSLDSRLGMLRTYCSRQCEVNSAG